MRQVWPLALMLCADRVPNNRAHFRRSALTQTGSPDLRNDRICITSSCPRQLVLRRYRNGLSAMCPIYPPHRDRRTNIAGFLKRAKRTRAPQQTTYGAFRPKRRGLPRAPRSAVPPWSRSVSRVCRCPIRTNVLSGDRFKSFSRRLSVLLMGRRTFSLWWGSNDKLRGERDPGVNGICDEAVGFDAFHGFAGRLEFGFSLEGDAGSDRGFGDVVLPLDVLEEALADEQLFGRPDVRLAFE